MAAGSDREGALVKNPTTVEPTSERELVVRRMINGPARLVFEAWTRPELFKQWWVPKSAPITLISCDMDVRVGGTYRLVFAAGPSDEMAFFGRYTEVEPHSRLVWTSDESDEAGSVTTVTFQEQGDQTLLVVRELYPSKEAALASGAMDGMAETLDQLDELLTALRASEEGS